MRALSSRLLWAGTFAVAATTAVAGLAGGSGTSDAGAPAAFSPLLGDLPRGDAPSRAQASPVFVRNAGQWGRGIDFASQGSRYRFAFSERGVDLALATRSDGSALSLRFRDASRGVRLMPRKRLSGKVNVLVGDRRRWRSGLPTYGELLYRDLWRGVDLAFAGQGGTLKYEFRVAPGADLRRIRMVYEGARRLSVARDGSLRIHTANGTLRDARPVSYQLVGRRRQPVASRYVLDGRTGYRFAVGGHDPRRPLVIDPGLEYGTYLGGVGGEFPWGVAVDGRGDVYAAGWSEARDYPTTPSAVHPADPDPRPGALGRDAVVTKLDPQGGLIWSTYLGGTTHRDEALDIAVDRRGHVHVGGLTQATDFPTTPGALQPHDPNGRETLDGWMAKLSPDGSRLIYSTYLGAPRADQVPENVFQETGVVGLALSGENAVACGAGDAPLFPTTPGAADTTWNGMEDVWVAKLSEDGSSLLFSTFVGGTGADHTQQSCAVDPRGNVYVGIGTKSRDFPTTENAFQASDPDPTGDDAAVAKISADGSRLLYGTYVGGPSEELRHRFFTTERVLGLDVDANGRVYAAGQTDSREFPTTPGALDGTYNGGALDAFAFGLEEDGSKLLFSTYLGGSNSDRADGVTVDRGHFLIAGRTVSPDFPTTADAFQPTDPDPRLVNAGTDALLVELDKRGDLRYSTYLGGTDFDSAASVAVHDDASAWISGSTLSANFPTSAGALQAVDPDPSPTGRDGFVVKLRTGGPNGGG